MAIFILTKILRGLHGLPYPVRRQDPPLQHGAGSLRRRPCMKVSNVRVMDQPFHTNQLHSKQKRHAAHFPNGSHPRTSRKVPYWYREYSLITFRVRNVDSQAASDSSQRDRYSRFPSRLYFQLAATLDRFHPPELPQ